MKAWHHKALCGHTSKYMYCERKVLCKELILHLPIVTVIQFLH